METYQFTLHDQWISYLHKEFNLYIKFTTRMYLRLCFVFLLRSETMFLFFTEIWDYVSFFLLRHETMVFFVYLDLRLCFFFFLLRLWYYFVVLRLCYYFTDPPGAPTIEGYSDSDHVVEERAARMTCKSVGGNPTATLRWFKGKGDQPGGQWPTALPCYPATERNTIVF